ncbi:hypothetical protein BLD44_028575 [Mastigocladus laminosus UU774]|nr:hypothetical protein BLD44_028575 [Mastigocladus laminosus UU774]
MDEQLKQEILNLLKPVLNDFQQAITANVEGRFSAFQQSLVTNEDDNQQPPQEPNNPQVDALRGELETLKSQLATEKQTARDKALMAEMLGIGQTKKVIAPQLFTDAFLARNKDKIIEHEGQWFIKDGDKTTALSQYVDTFLTTDEGKALLPPSGANGTGSPEPKQQTNAATPPNVTNPWEVLYTALRNEHSPK